jgi:ficolin
MYKNLHILTSTTPTELRVDVQDWEGQRRFAKYSTFKIGDASSKYTLYAEGYSGNAGKSW